MERNHLTQKTNIMQTTTETIAKVLLMQSSEYTEANMERYLRWCIDKSTQFNIELQQVVANTKIANYYRTEFERLEDAFLKEAKPIHGKVRYTTMRKLYNEHVVEIFKIYPKPLLEEAKKLQVINHLYN